MAKKIIFLTLLFILISILYIYFNYTDTNILLHIRLPRYMLVLFCGMVLAGCGSIYQVMLNNPLAEPYILGISSGAALGSILGGLTGYFVLMPVFGFVGSVATMYLVWFISHFDRQNSPNRLLFSGIIVGMFLSSLISLLMYLFQRDTALILGVLMGSTGHIFSQREWVYFCVSFAVSVCLLVYLFLLSNQLNILTSGDEVATSMGVNVKRLRMTIFFVSSVLIGLSVAFCGIIGFVGLIVPHLVRLAVGAEQKRVYVFSIIGGAVFMLVCDFLASQARLLAGVELPVGIITSFLGCPLFVYMLFMRFKG